MTEKTEQLNKRRAEALASLVGDLDAMADAQPNTQRPEHLLELYIQKLNERELISANEGPKDEFTKTPLGSETASADAFGISFSGEGEEESAQVNVFVVDPRISPAVENLNVEQVKAFFRKAQNFIQSLKDGTLERRVPDSNPSKKAAHAVYEAVKAEAVKEWRIWLVTTSVWRTVGDKAMAIPRDLMPDAAMEVLDLDFYRLDEDAGISQKFEEPGLPCIAFEVSESQDYSCYLTVISGVILADLYHKHGTALVEENVRAYLGNNKVNKQVKETIKNNPERFLAYNNGLVVSAGGVSFGDEKHARIRFIEQMQIINGGQTTVSIYQSLYNTTRSREPEVRRKLKDLFIPMKVVVPSPKLEDEEKRALRDQISRAANSQSAVKTSDLAANGPFQIKFAQIVQGLQTPDRKYWFYERARGLYKADLSKKKYSEKRIWEEEHPADKVIDKTELSTAWLAWNGYPVECAKGKEIAFNFFREAFIDAKTGLPKSEHDKMNEDFANHEGAGKVRQGFGCRARTAHSESAGSCDLRHLHLQHQIRHICGLGCSLERSADAAGNAPASAGNDSSRRCAHSRGYGFEHDFHVGTETRLSGFSAEKVFVRRDPLQSIHAGAEVAGRISVVSGWLQKSGRLEINSVLRI